MTTDSIDVSEDQPPVRQRFRSLATSLPTDFKEEEELDMPFNIFSYLDPTDESFDESNEDDFGEDDVNVKVDSKSVSSNIPKKTHRVKNFSIKL